MLTIGRVASRDCRGITRRELLQVGGASLLGLSLADRLRAEEAAESRPQAAGAKACIFIFLEGGPSQLETFDPKPQATDDTRGPFGSIATTVPGYHVGELLPMLATRADRYAVIRSVTGFSGAHDAYQTLTGDAKSRTSHGAIVTRLTEHQGAMPPYVHVGGKLFRSTDIGGGVLGSAFDPIEIADPLDKDVKLPNLALSADVSPARFLERRGLLGALDQVRSSYLANAGVQRFDAFYQRAVGMLTSTKVRDAFDVKLEPEALRVRYGANFFGQSLLMARRLVEAGTRYVQVKWYDWDGAWDIHGFNSTGIERMEEELCPRFDQGLSALLDDLQERGLLESTLVVAMGEMGRTPKINKWGGRDHWGNSLFCWMAGGGIPGGTIVGATDDQAAFPARDPVMPMDLAATIYSRMGINTNTDPRVRPFIGSARPVESLV